MKYFVGGLVTLLVLGGILLGFSLGMNTGTNSTTDVGNTANNMPSSGLDVLDYSNKGLTKVTSEIYSKTATTNLRLSNNSIKTLPTEMGNMTNLVVFEIDHNILEGSLIGEIRQMSELEMLDVSYNKMTGVPAEIGQLRNLQTLNYSFSNITGLPNELANLKNNLKEFNLTGNPLSQDKIDRLKAQLPNTTIIF